MKTLNDKVVLITGAGGAIAGAVEAALRNAGARVVLVDKDIVRVQGRAASYNALALEADLHSLENAAELVETVRSEVSHIDGVVHLVGDIVSGSVADLDSEAFDTAFDSNVRTLFYITKALLAELSSREEAFIVGLGSQGAWGVQEAGSSLFTAAKSAVASYLRSLDQELSATGVSVTTIFPVGAVDTLSNRQALRGDKDTPLISPKAIAAALVTAVLSGEGGRLTEVAVHPPRREMLE